MEDMNGLQIMDVAIHSEFFGVDIILPAYYRKDGSLLVLHSGLKNFLFSLMKDRAQNNRVPIHFNYQHVMTSEVHWVVNCTISMGSYSVTETGESSIRTLYTEIARNYPYLEAQKRAFDRAVISFFQFRLDGKRVYSETEMAPVR